MTTDCRIAAKVDWVVYAGETWQIRGNVLDKNREPIDLTGFNVGPLVIYDQTARHLAVQTISELSVSGSQIVGDPVISSAIKKNMVNGYYYECPLLPPGGSPVAIIHGIIQIDGK